MNTGDLFSQSLKQCLKTTSEREKIAVQMYYSAPYNGSSSSLHEIDFSKMSESRYVISQGAS